jgi:protein-S-isoprenylcysteine O-methyltransferase Ste14
MWVLMRALAYATCFVGILLVLLPACLLSFAGIAAPHTLGVQQISGIAVAAVAAALLISCILTFVFIGKGTQAPFDAPRLLVIRGPYRVIRNPMYLGATGVLAGSALYYGSAVLSIYAIIFWIVTHCGVIFFEEPALARVFGSEYDNYRAHVGRWLPRR